MIAGTVLSLFAWTFVSGTHWPGSSIAMDNLSVALAVLSIALAAISYFFAPEKLRTTTAYAAYLFLIGTVSVLILDTGGSGSPFIALWLVTTVFAGIFGTRTIGLLFAIVNGFLLWLLFNHQLDKTVVQGIILAGELPVIVTYILWHTNSRSEKSKDRAYYDLANELNQVSNKAEVVINAIGDGVIAVDNQGVIELINPAAQRIAGWGRQDALGLDYKSVLQLLGKDGHELDKATDPVFDVLTTNQQKRTSDLTLQTNSGKRIAVSLVISPIGRLGAGAIIVFRDITKELAEEQEQAEFISTASHEMRTPVAAIEGYLGLALNPATATIDAKAHEFITKAHESAQHLGRLFQDLLDISKADDGRLSNNPKVVNVVQFTQSIMDGLQHKADAKGLRIFFKPSIAGGDESSGLTNLSPMFYVHLDADHLREVLANLIENAIKYTPSGEVVVDVTGDSSHVVISVSDSGIGIPAEDIPHLFQKFYRVDNTDTREIGGTGLGLYLCRRLIEAMNGRIWVESEYKHGSTFFVELPRITHEEANHLIEASADQPTAATHDSYLEDENGPAQGDQVASTDTPIIQLHTNRLAEARQAMTEAAAAEKSASLFDPGAEPAPVPQTPPVSTKATVVVPPAAVVQPELPAAQPQPAPAISQPASQPQPAATAPQPVVDTPVPVSMPAAATSTTPPVTPAAIPTPRPAASSAPVATPIPRPVAPPERPASPPAPRPITSPSPAPSAAPQPAAAQPAVAPAAPAATPTPVPTPSAPQPAATAPQPNPAPQPVPVAAPPASEPIAPQQTITIPKG